ncbi:MAG: putative transposase, partial [Thermotogaceae bacterium]|nr:putative transposase [Thermotogaceae bacterium]
DRDVNAAKNLAKYGLMLSLGREPSEFKPVDRALTAERKENSSGLRVITG